MKKPFIRTPYNYNVDEASDLTGLSCGEPTRAQQQFKDECDINTIMRRFGKTGVAPVAAAMPSYDDYTGIVDFHTAMNAVAQARENFETLPSNVRLRFNNDPGDFVSFCLDDRNRDEALSLGLINTPLPTQSPQPDTKLPEPSGSPSIPVNPVSSTVPS